MLATVYVCLTCPNAGGGLYVLYAIKPNSIKCAEVAYAEMPAFKLFTYGKTQYDSEAVSAYIRGK
ncbi:hypothetical protein BCY91_08190 [Pelobium manganitolerans]|uniref:Uncharacterized protein n=1 Tax=Pelobium manganitolerans TaxID=1842495 RepID=A0A419S466_9SPHI|nr:hypothetical protein [Pelobium manganitolerans]RKD14443.1 hypothetical protein BCY91_08190 [Pelobium manganitolerans]